MMDTVFRLWMVVTLALCALYLSRIAASLAILASPPGA